MKCLETTVGETTGYRLDDYTLQISVWVESVDFHDEYELSRLQFVSYGCN